MDHIYQNVLFSFPILVYAQEYNSYTMFNNFSIVAPDTPTALINDETTTLYSSKEEAKDIAVLIQSRPVGLDFDIGEYNLSIKKIMDEAIIKGEDIQDYQVTHFSSTFNRKNNIYIAAYFADPKKVGEGAYMAKKVIIKGKNRYSWVVISYNKNDTVITFNKYKDRVK